MNKMKSFETVKQTNDITFIRFKIFAFVILDLKLTCIKIIICLFCHLFAFDLLKACNDEI